jgi:hypothetical protein
VDKDNLRIIFQNIDRTGKLLLLFKLFIGFLYTYIDITFTLHSIMINLHVSFIHKKISFWIHSYGT